VDLKLGGKYALVTGGTHGIGLSTAIALAQEGCHVAVCSRSQDRIDSAVTEIRSCGVLAIGIQADVLKENDIHEVMDRISAEWGGVHILVNNVGGGGRWGLEDVVQTPENVWQEVYDKNAMAAVRFTMRAIPFMQKQQWGRVVTIASIFGRQYGGRPWFNMAKAAQVTLMKNLARKPELARKGITFNTIAPGAIMIPETGWEEQQRQDPQAFDRLLDKQFPLGRLGKPEEVAAAVVFLASECSSLINGACILADGGESDVL
jgi:3-oxoacyl-[acyl-carrier protein] reductase